VASWQLLIHEAAPVVVPHHDHQLADATTKGQGEHRDDQNPVRVLVTDDPTAVDDHPQRVLRVEDVTNDRTSTEAVTRVPAHVEAGSGDDERQNHQQKPADFHREPPTLAGVLVAESEKLGKHCDLA